MTQYIVTTRSPADLDPPKGIRAVPVDEVLRAHLRTAFPTAPAACAKIVESESGEADALLDALHHRADAGSGFVLMSWLESLAARGVGIAMWYGNESGDLPLCRDWDAFSDVVDADAAGQPPEAYACLPERSPSDKRIPTGLPETRRWQTNSSRIDFRFHAPRPLPEITDVPLPRGWADLYPFGEYDVAAGGGANPWLALNAAGNVLELDLDRDDEVVVIAPSLEVFVASFRAIDEFVNTSRAEGSRDAQTKLESLHAPGPARQFWVGLIRYLRPSPE